METETLDKLYLEWSQFTKARTAREIAMEKALQWIAGVPGAHPNNIRAVAQDALDAVSSPLHPGDQK
jgi:hypothetical protein